MAVTTSDPLGHCDLDLGGPSLASIMLAIVPDLLNCDLDIRGLGYNY